MLFYEIFQVPKLFPPPTNLSHNFSKFLLALFLQSFAHLFPFYFLPRISQVQSQDVCRNILVPQLSLSFSLLLPLSSRQLWCHKLQVYEQHSKISSRTKVNAVAYSFYPSLFLSLIIVMCSSSNLMVPMLDNSEVTGLPQFLSLSLTHSFTLHLPPPSSRVCSPSLFLSPSSPLSPKTMLTLQITDVWPLF